MGRYMKQGSDRRRAFLQVIFTKKLTRNTTNESNLPGHAIVLHVRIILLLSMFFCIPPPHVNVHFVHSGSPEER